MKNPFTKESLNQEFLTLNLTDHNNNKKTYHILRRQAYGTFAALALFLSGCLYSYSYYRINTEKLEKATSQITEITQTIGSLEEQNTSLEEEKKALKEKSKLLEGENVTYKEKLTELEQKAQDIESKINELNQTKQDLYNKLNEISKANETEAETEVEIYTASVQSVPIETAPVSSENTFTSVVVTPFSSKNTKMDVLSQELNQMDAIVAEEKIAYIDVADDVTKTLAFVASKPSIWPVNGRVSSEFSNRVDPINFSSAFHTGLDIPVPMGTPVKATASGRVIAADSSKSGYGNRIEINHGNGYVTLYAHNTSLTVSAGDWVEKGDIIALSGATGRVTGPHVHYEVIYNGEYQNPRDFLN